MLPDFISIGAPRTGTTWMYEMLKQHPQIYMTSEKEIDFFSHHFDKGMDWYESFFDHKQEGKIAGDISPSYLANKNAPKRIRSVLPSIKLIISLRNPVQQVFSRYNYMKARQMYPGSFEDAIKNMPYLVEHACYYKNIKRYLKFFSEKQILVLLYEDLARDPSVFLGGIYRFLNIESSFLPNNIHERIHKSAIPRSRLFEFCIVAVRHFLRNRGLFPVVERIKELGWDKHIRGLNTKRASVTDDINIETRRALNKMFHDDKHELSVYLQRDLSFWQ